MKKLIALSIALILCLSCFSVSALESTPDEALSGYDYTLGKVGDYYLVYKAPEKWNDYYKSVLLGEYCVTMKCDDMPIYLADNNGGYALYESVIGSIIDEKDLALIEDLIKNCDCEPFKEKKITFYKFEPYEEPSEATPDEPAWQPVTCAPVCSDPIAPGEETEKFTTEPSWIVEPTEAPTYNPVINDPTKPQPPTEGVEKQQTTVAPILDNKKSEAANASKNAVRLNYVSATLKCGKTFKLKVYGAKGKKIKYLTSDKNVASVSAKGVVTTLKTGRAKISVKIGTKRLKCTVKVVTSPTLSKKSVTVKKGKKISVTVIGKAPNVNNKYKNTKKAKIISKQTESKLVVKGRRRGKTTLKITVNGVVLKLKVRVK